MDRNLTVGADNLLSQLCFDNKPIETKIKFSIYSIRRCKNLILPAGTEDSLGWVLFQPIDTAVADCWGTIDSNPAAPLNTEYTAAHKRIRGTEET